MNILPVRKENKEENGIELNKDLLNSKDEYVIEEVPVEDVISDFDSRRVENNDIVENYKELNFINNLKIPSLLIVSLSVLLIFLCLLGLVSTSLMYGRRTGNSEQVNLEQNKSVIINTNPPDADVYLNNVYMGISPVQIDLINLGRDYTLRIKKEGYKDYSMALKANEAKESYNINLISIISETVQPVTITPAVKDIVWSDYGLKLSVPFNFEESVSSDKVLCREVKSYLVNKDRCKNDYTVLDYNVKNLNFNNGSSNKVTMSVKIPNSSNDCSLTVAICSSALVKKIGSAKVLDQEVSVYQRTDKDSVITFLEPVIKTNGTDYTSIYIEFSGKVDYENILNMITKNA